MATIGRQVEAGRTRMEIYSMFYPLVRDQQAPFVFTENPVKGSGAKRIPLADINEQYRRLWWTIGKTINLMGGSEDLKAERPDSPDEPTPDEVPDETPKPHVTPKENPVQYYRRKLAGLREFLRERARVTNTPPLDQLALRPELDGVRGIMAGISADAMLTACTLHWPADALRDAGIRHVDFARESEPVGPEYHRLTGYCLKLQKAGIPIMLIGESGGGKSFLLRQLADLLEFQYGECPMTAGATPSWLLGNWNIKGDFVTRQAMERYAHGGIFNFEEIDASDPNMLLVSNQMLAADSYFNPASGEEIKKSADYVPASTANTLSQGANRQFTGRERLDFATVDRWRMGRVLVEFDPVLADNLVRKMIEGTEFEYPTN